MNREFLVSGNGFSVTCNQDSLLGWIDFFLDMGAAPVVKEITNGLVAAQ